MLTSLPHGRRRIIPRLGRVHLLILGGVAIGTIAESDRSGEVIE
jgi:hypothetical protein